MTAIAYRDGIMAADSRVIRKNLKIDPAVEPSKIFRAKVRLRKKDKAVECLVGGAGEACPDDFFVKEWLEENPLIELPALYGNFRALVVFPSRRIFEVSDDGDMCPILLSFYAIGAGAEICMGAMEMRATAKQAVAAAIKWCPDCDGPIVSERI